MGIRKKVLTIDCPSCNDLEIDDDNNFTCNWNSRSEDRPKVKKILVPHKGRRPRSCKLTGGS